MQCSQAHPDLYQKFCDTGLLEQLLLLFFFISLAESFPPLPTSLLSYSHLSFFFFFMFYLYATWISESLTSCAQYFAEVLAKMPWQS